MSFALNMGKWAANAKEEMASLNKAIVLELFASVIKDTPVLEGRLRGNWIISSNNPASGQVTIESTVTGAESSSREDDTRGRVTTETINNVLSHLGGTNFKKDFDLYLTNNLPYAYRIEYDGWSHTKAPEGMVRKNMIRISENLLANV